MKSFKTNLEGVLVIHPDVYEDERGFFTETYSQIKYNELGINEHFVQDNFSLSTKGTLRGLHYQLNYPQAKLVRVLKGEVFDVAVDIREGSPTFAKWTSILLTGENKKQLWIPPGFAHGFLVLSDYADFEYKCTDYYDSDDECGILWNDPELNIQWPNLEPILSKRDAIAPTLLEFFG